LNIGRIQGGTTINSIASQAWLELDLRSEDDARLLELAGKVEEAVERHRARELRLELARIGERPAGGLPLDHPLVRAAGRALREAGERRVVFETGSTDASVPLHHGYPAVCVGLTRGGGAHTAEEYIEISPLRRGYKALVRLIEAAYELR
jgi:acetylornithine deacetylase/succinyl-diaminopimelate desuccinylase-like protein